MLEYEWDESKNKLNRKKHGVWFEEAQHVFDDPSAILFVNREHSIGEERFILLGFCSPNRILVVIFCERGRGNRIRIISARSATKREIKRYEEGI